MTFKLRTLKKRADFLRARDGRYHVTPGLILQASRKRTVEPQAGKVVRAVEPGPKFGFTATKKLGNAVVRNRIKRRLREAVRRIAPQMARDEFEYVLIGRNSTLKRPFSSLLHDLRLAFQKVHDDSRGGAKGRRHGHRPQNRAPKGRKRIEREGNGSN